MTKLLAEFDWILFGVIIALLLFGLLVIASTASSLFFQQLVYVVLGLILFYLTTKIDYRIYSRFSWWLYFISICFLGLTLLLGTAGRGAVRWIQIGSLTIQPSELVKPFLIIFFAWFFSQTPKQSFGRIFFGSLLLVLPVFLIFIQPDLGSSLVVVCIWLGIICAAGISWRWLIGGFSFLIGVSPFIWHFLEDYQRQRIYTFLNPMSDPLKSGYNIIQSIVAVGSGQLLGRGLGKGTQSHLRFLPERHTDFIFASLAEELGFLGVLLLVLFFFVLGWRILVVAQKTEGRFGFLVLIGVFTMVFSQVFVNLGMNLGLLPITGITLPLISSGGSSLVAVLISVGIAENIAGQVERKEVKYL